MAVFIGRIAWIDSQLVLAVANFFLNTLKMYITNLVSHPYYCHNILLNLLYPFTRCHIYIIRPSRIERVSRVQTLIDFVKKIIWCCYQYNSSDWNGFLSTLVSSIPALELYWTQRLQKTLIKDLTMSMSQYNDWLSSLVSLLGIRNNDLSMLTAD